MQRQHDYIYRSFTISLGPHLINFRFQFVRGSGDLFIFEFEGTSGGFCRELIFEFESPPVNAACALLLLFVEEAEAVAEAEAEAEAEAVAEAVADDTDAAQCSEAGKER